MQSAGISTNLINDLVYYFGLKRLSLRPRIPVSVQAGRTSDSHNLFRLINKILTCHGYQTMMIQRIDSVLERFENVLINPIIKTVINTNLW